MNQQLQNQQENNIGRPTLKTEEVVRKLEDMLRLGLSNTAACAYAKVSRDTFYRWVKEDDDFSDKMESARQYAIIASRQLIVSRIINKEEDIEKRTELAKWYVEKHDTKLQGQVSQNTQVNVFSQLKEKYSKPVEDLPDEVDVTIDGNTEENTD